eukprot:TRINITY_DN22941_c0_g1_i1.p1 TRINITY_DN22941_c0_g1~~TRINITY_DN22941_c0_g1_i1.p1  ORF type:complete len:622 (+),score=101.80 TRINITY_DN22941_c0_g1_i1:33-1898(+)
MVADAAMDEPPGATPAPEPGPWPALVVSEEAAAAAVKASSADCNEEIQIPVFKSVLVDVLESHKKELLECIWKRFAHQEDLLESLARNCAIAGDEALATSPEEDGQETKLLGVLPEREALEQPAPLLKRKTTYELAQEKSLNKLDTKRQLGDSVRTRRKFLGELVQSPAFEAIVAILIISNSLLIGVQVQYAAEHIDEPMPVGFTVAQTTYSFVFLMELILRILADGSSFFTEFDDASKWGWNMLDLFVVATSMFEIGVNFVSPDTSTSLIPTTGLRILRVVRITRLIRVIRIVRVVRFIRALRTLVYSIFCTLRALIWSMFLLVLIMYVFSIILTDTVISEVNESGMPENHKVLQHFGSIHASMQTLFKSLTGGLTWNEALDPLVDLSGWMYGAVFLIYIAFCYFAVLNVMTGVFCHSAIRSAERDHELAIQAIHQDKKRYVDMVMKIFNKIDEDASGSISILEFERGFQDREVRAMLTSLELDAHDAWTLFRALDFDGDNLVLAEEFLEGCLTLKGSAKAVDLANFRKDIKSNQTELEQKLQDLMSMTSDMLNTVNNISRQPSKRQAPSRHPTSSTQVQLGVGGSDASHESQERAADVQNSATHHQNLPGNMPDPVELS